MMIALPNAPMYGHDAFGPQGGGALFAPTPNAGPLAGTPIVFGPPPQAMSAPGPGPGSILGLGPPHGPFAAGLSTTPGGSALIAQSPQSLAPLSFPSTSTVPEAPQRMSVHGAGAVPPHAQLYSHQMAHPEAPSLSQSLPAVPVPVHMHMQSQLQPHAQLQPQFTPTAIGPGGDGPRVQPMGSDSYMYPQLPLPGPPPLPLPPPPSWSIQGMDGPSVMSLGALPMLPGPGMRQSTQGAGLLLDRSHANPPAPGPLIMNPRDLSLGPPQISSDSGHPRYEYMIAPDSAPAQSPIHVRTVGLGLSHAGSDGHEQQVYLLAPGPHMSSVLSLEDIQKEVERGAALFFDAPAVTVARTVSGQSLLCAGGPQGRIYMAIPQEIRIGTGPAAGPVPASAPVPRRGSEYLPILIGPGAVGPLGAPTGPSSFIPDQPQLITRPSGGSGDIVHSGGAGVPPGALGLSEAQAQNLAVGPRHVQGPGPGGAQL